MAVDYGPQISALTAQANALAGRITSVESRLTALEGRLDTAEANITDLDARPIVYASASTPTSLRAGGTFNAGDGWIDT